MWAKFDDQTPQDPEIDALSDGAFRLWFNAICYAQAQLTDGFVPASIARRLTPNYRPTHLAELTRRADDKPPIFEPVGDGYLIRNFAKWNKTRDHWEAKRSADAARIADYRARKGA